MLAVHEAPLPLPHCDDAERGHENDAHENEEDRCVTVEYILVEIIGPDAEVHQPDENSEKNILEGFPSQKHWIAVPCAEEAARQDFGLPRRGGGGGICAQHGLWLQHASVSAPAARTADPRPCRVGISESFHCGLGFGAVPRSDAEVEVRGVLVHRALLPLLGKILHAVGPWAEVGHAPARQKHKVVEHGRDVRIGLVDRTHHGAPPPREVAQVLHQGEGDVAVQARGGLVEVQHSGVRYELDPDAEAPPLPAGQAPVPIGSDHGVDLVCHVQLF
mmetsp:Transcript_62029/g.196117  ORF Transcript_62029/g.196117 Transcript_62029/m.196117 type:complete len:275 (+) Transcript_62029:493-1317(+)